MAAAHQLNPTRQAVILHPDAGGPGMELLARGDFDGAVAVFSKALGEGVDCLVNLGTALGVRGDAGPAVAAFRAAIAAKPREPVAYSNLGLCLRMVGETDAALVSFVEAVRLRPDCAEASSNACVALAERGRLEDAAHCAHHAVAALCASKKKSVSAARYNFARVLLDSPGREDEAMAEFIGLKDENMHADCLNNIGCLYLQRNEAHKAFDCFRQANAVKPDPLYRANLGLANLLRGDPIEVALKHLEGCEDNHRAVNNLGVALATTDWHRAAAAFNKAYQLAPQHPAYAANLGLILLTAAVGASSSSSNAPHSNGGAAAGSGDDDFSANTYDEEYDQYRLPNQPRDRQDMYLREKLDRATQALAFLQLAQDADGRYRPYRDAAKVVQRALRILLERTW